MSANQGVLLRSSWRPAKTLCKERNLIGYEDSCLINGIFYPGLFQASLVISYTTYLTWPALSHEPDELCYPPGYFISGYDHWIESAGNCQRNFSISHAYLRQFQHSH